MQLVLEEILSEVEVFVLMNLKRIIISFLRYTGHSEFISLFRGKDKTASKIHYVEVKEDISLGSWKRPNTELKVQVEIGFTSLR